MATLVVPKRVPSPKEDAKKIRKAFKGFETDEKAIVSILGHRNAAQRSLIKKSYQDLYNEVLIKRLKAELNTGKFERALSPWVHDPAERDAILAHVAIKYLNRNYRVIIEIACELPPDDLLAMKRAYQSRYKCALEEDVASHTTGDLRKILVALIGTYRYDGSEIDTRKALSEANTLHSAIDAKAFNHEDVIRILTTRSKAQLNATFNCYRDVHGMSITKKLVGEPADGFVDALKTIARCISDPTKYYEKVVRDAINKGDYDDTTCRLISDLGKYHEKVVLDVTNKKGDYEDATVRCFSNPDKYDDLRMICDARDKKRYYIDSLTRVIVRHAETNLKEIKELYYKRNSVALDKAVAKVTSGNYKAFLLTLLGSEGY